MKIIKSMTKLLEDKRMLLFITSLLITVGSWILILDNWSALLTTSAIGGLFIQLANGVFQNAIKNVGIFGTGVTNESDPLTQNPQEKK
jgi:hypothetical protein